MLKTATLGIKLPIQHLVLLFRGAWASTAYIRINITILTPLQGISAALSTLALPALLALPTAVNARTTFDYLSSKSQFYTAYLRHITTFTLFSAYLISPRRSRHPYLLYTSILAFVSGPGIDYAVSWRGTDEKRAALDLQAQGEEVNGEQVREAVERKKVTESVKATFAGIAFGMAVVGLWGDGA
jgi:autophagy-related protein 33